MDRLGLETLNADAVKEILIRNAFVLGMANSAAYDKIMGKPHSERSGKECLRIAKEAENAETQIKAIQGTFESAFKGQSAACGETSGEKVLKLTKSKGGKGGKSSLKR